MSEILTQISECESEIIQMSESLVME